MFHMHTEPAQNETNEHCLQWPSLEHLFDEQHLTCLESNENTTKQVEISPAAKVWLRAALHKYSNQKDNEQYSSQFPPTTSNGASILSAESSIQTHPILSNKTLLDNSEAIKVTLEQLTEASIQASPRLSSISSAREYPASKMALEEPSDHLTTKPRDQLVELLASTMAPEETCVSQWPNTIIQTPRPPTDTSPRDHLMNIETGSSRDSPQQEPTVGFEAQPSRWRARIRAVRGIPADNETKLSQIVKKQRVDDADRTTIMVRHIPHTIKYEEMLGIVNSTGVECDFMYLPASRNGSRSRSYAFVNFKTPDDATHFMRVFEGHQFGENKFAAVGFARLQGYIANFMFFGDIPSYGNA